jgi:DnaJ-class molecular chaperone
MGDHYQTLGIQRDANKADIKNAYFRLAHRYHPDHHNHTDAARPRGSRRPLPPG